MTGLPSNIEEILNRLAERSRSDLDLVRALSENIRRTDEQLFQEVHSIAHQHELRREAIFAELQALAHRLCLLPKRSVTATMESLPEQRMALDAPVRPGPGDWRRAAEIIDDELDHVMNGQHRH